MKLCKDCEHFVDYGMCARTTEVNPVTGDPRLLIAAFERTGAFVGFQRCGEEARFFKVKPELKPKMGWLRSLFRRGK